MADPITTEWTKDKRFYRRSTDPERVWTCATCRCAVLDGNKAAHTAYHKEHEGFGS